MCIICVKSLNNLSNWVCSDVCRAQRPEHLQSFCMCVWSLFVPLFPLPLPLSLTTFYFCVCVQLFAFCVFLIRPTECTTDCCLPFQLLTFFLTLPLPLPLSLPLSLPLPLPLPLPVSLNFSAYFMKYSETNCILKMRNYHLGKNNNWTDLTALWLTTCAIYPCTATEITSTLHM